MDNEKDNRPATCYISANGSKEYFQYDRLHHTARTRRGVEVYITEEKLLDFLHTADMLGFKAGRV